jgi:chemotaxis protein histidine kinase CheA
MNKAATRRKPIELFMPPNILKAKAGGRYGGLDMGAIRRAEHAVSALKSEFRGWAGEDIRKLVAANDHYAKSGAAEARTTLLRLAHDLKGQAASFELPLISRIAGSLSRLLGESREDAAMPDGLVNAHIGAVQVIFRENIVDEKNEIARLLCTELDARVSEALKPAKTPHTSRKA